MPSQEAINETDIIQMPTYFDDRNKLQSLAAAHNNIMLMMWLLTVFNFIDHTIQFYIKQNQDK